MTATFFASIFLKILQFFQIFFTFPPNYQSRIPIPPFLAHQSRSPQSLFAKSTADRGNAINIDKRLGASIFNVVDRVWRDVGYLAFADREGIIFANQQLALAGYKNEHFLIRAGSMLAAGLAGT